jgi:2-polyprenyl-6-methoxyphenol hydroxylase-like FAD-dependent oxidoreductase
MENENLDHDIIIVGGRVAGSLVATLLGEKGHRVLMLDRARFPSDTISTHFFRAPSFRAFQQAGVYDQVQATAPHLTVNYNVVDGHVFPEPVDRPDDYPFHMCVRRITLDDILNRHVKRTPNVELREGAKVDGLLRENGRVVGVTWQGSDGRGQATAKAVIGADGVYSFVAKEVDAQAEHAEPVNRAMYYGYYRGIAPNDGPAAEFHYRGNNLVYCFPCDGDLMMVAVSVPIADFADFKRDLEDRFMGELEAMTEVGPRLAGAEREGPLRGSGSIPGYMRVPYGNGWALVGDSAMVMDPWSGQGIDQASTHAVYLAQYLGEYLDGEKDWESAMQSYHQERNAFSEKTYQRTCKFSRDLRPMTRTALKRRGLV